MQKQPNTFAAPAVQILHFLYFYIGLLGFFVGDGVHPSLLLIGFLSFFSVSALLVGKVVGAEWRSGGRDNSNYTASRQEIPLLCITFLHRYINRINAGNNRGFFRSKYSFFGNKPGKGLCNPYQTLIKPLASLIHAPYAVYGVGLSHTALQGINSQKSPDYGIQQERRQEPHLCKHLKAAAIQL
jgi:hypothetical protein